MRIFWAVTLMSILVLAAALASSSSCVIDTRDLDGGIDGDVAVIDGGTDAFDANETSLDCGCCNQAVVPGLPYCSGMTAYRYPVADDMKNPCKGPAAYAICANGCYTAWSCSLPPGYTLLDSGIPITHDAGSDRATGDGASMDAADSAADAATGS